MHLPLAITDDWDRYEDLHEDWLNLLKGSPRPTPFEDPDFCRLWLRYREKSGDPFVTVLTDGDGHLKAIAPLCIVTSTKMRIRLRRLRFMVSVPYLDSDFIPQNIDSTTIESLLSHAIEHSGADLVELFSFPRQSGSVLAVEKAMKRMGLRFEISHSRPWKNALIRLSGTWEEYLARRSAKFRYGLRRSQRKFQNLGEVRVERYRSPDNLDELIPCLERISKSSWKDSSEYAKGGFFRELIQLTSSKGWLDLHLLILDDNPVAFLVLLRFRDTIYAMQSAYDPDFSKASPGVYLISKVLEDTLTHPGGEIWFDFLTNYDYLARFADCTGARVKILGFPKGVRPWAFSCGYRLRTALTSERGTIRSKEARQLLTVLDGSG